MKIGKKSRIFLIATVIFSLVLTIFFSHGSNIKANEGDTEATVESTASSEEILNLPSLPETEEDLHNKENITNEDMISYMNGTAYQSPQALADSGKITGSMTEADYKARFAALNQQQNDAWNAKYNFVHTAASTVTVSTYTEFRNAYTNNAISKIILAKDILSTDETTASVGYIHRTESIEIDGQGHRLHLLNGSINVENLTSLANFEGKFSDVPVFHMHDIQPTNASSAGQGEAAPYWGFVNGAGNLAANTGRRLWQYRIGNVYTPHASGTRNNLIRGRLIGGNQANISIWGYNYLVTAAENFYTGGIEVEPYSYYRGEIAIYDYSTVWFIRDPSASTDSTGTGKFTTGEGSFVYLNNTGSGRNYPGVYEYCKEINIGNDATFNVNVPGVAVEFNVNDGKFIANEGSTINLLSRSGSYPTMSAGSFIATHGSTQNPSNVSYEFKSTSNLFVVGSNSGGVVGYNTTAGGAQIVINNPETYDIRNNYNSTTTTNAFLQDGTSTRGTNSFTINNSDISIWNNTAAMDGAPTYDYADVTQFKVTNAVAAGTVTSTHAELQSQYTRPNFKRISGMNSTPQLIWTPVTDADYSQRATVLIGYTAVGGSDPFDENGDAYTKPVYADATRKAYVDYTDTFGNTYTGASTNDNYVHWNPTTDTTRGSIYQTAGLEMKGTPYRASTVNGVLTPYRTGEEKTTAVLDVTPPEPATLLDDTVTNATKQLKAENLEAGAKVLVSINGETVTAAGTVAADGTWTYDLPGYLTVGQTVVIYLQDNAEKIASDLDPSPIVATLPSTNTADGNINPYPNAVTYSDATFQPAKQYTVVDILPDQPSMSKTVKAYRNDTEVNTTQVGDTLLYTLTAKNGKAQSFTTTWANVTITDTLPDGLTFDEGTADLTVTVKNSDSDTGTAVTPDYTYDPTTRLLTVNAGNLSSQQSAVVTFKTKVAHSAVGTTISNTAKAAGESPQEETFVVGPEDPTNPRHIYFAESTAVDNPGGEIFGILSFVSAPDVINFGVETNHVDTRVNKPEYDNDLVVSDSRAQRDSWRLMVELTEVLTSQEDSTKTLPDAIRYKRGTNPEITLNGQPQEIYRETSGNSGEFTISDTWSESGDGFKLEVPAGQVRKLGNYQAQMLWTLVDAN